MATIKITELRRFNEKLLVDRMQKTKQKLLQVNAQLSSGGSVENNGQIKELKRTIARIKTLQRERKEE